MNQYNVAVINMSFRNYFETHFYLRFQGGNILLYDICLHLWNWWDLPRAKFLNKYNKIV